MKMTESMKRAQENMKPGTITAEGFLGQENIPIKDMIVRDESEMSKAGLTFEKTAEKLSYLLSTVTGSPRPFLPS